MDRIVNQLLTEMDGVETLNGVSVIAAASRPDLIDKALLRPSRLDKHVFCSLPNFKDRVEILGILARKQRLDQEISLVDIAASTDNYSGADLTSILSEAHLHTVGECLKVYENDLEVPESIQIGLDDIIYAVEHARPSSNAAERAYLGDIYWNFSKGKICGEMGKVTYA